MLKLIRKILKVASQDELDWNGKWIDVRVYQLEQKINKLNEQLIKHTTDSSAHGRDESEGKGESSNSSK